MPISLSTVTVFVPHATFYFREGEVWVLRAGKSRSDAINKQVVQKCLCLIWHVARSSALNSHWLKIWLVAFVPSTLYYKKILQWSSNVKVLKMGTSKNLLAIPLFCYGWGNRSVQIKIRPYLFHIPFKNCRGTEMSAHCSSVDLQRIWSRKKERSEIASDLLQPEQAMCWSISFCTSTVSQKSMLACEHLLSSENS